MAVFPSAAESSRQDANQHLSLTVVQGSAGTATAGTTLTMPVTGDPVTGAMYVNNIGAGGAAGGSNVNVFTGTQQTLGTVGVVNNIVTGTIASDNITSGTQQTLGTVGVINNIVTGTLATAGTVTGVGVVTSVTNLVSGTLLSSGTITGVGTITNLGSTTNLGQVYNAGTVQAVVTGTIGGKAASGAVAVANPVQIAGTDSGGTVYSPLVTTAGAQLTGLTSSGTLLNLASGTLAAITSVTNLAAGTVTAVNNVVTGTLAAVTSITNLAAGTVTSLLSQSAGTLNTLGTVGVVNNVVTGTIAAVTSVTNLAAGTVTSLLSQSAGTLNTLGTVGVVNAGTVHLAGTVLDNYVGLGTFTITVAGLASSATVGRQSTLVDNTTNLWPSALIGAQITAGTVTAAGQINIYLIRSDNGGGPIQDDLTGASDAAGTVNNSPLLGVIPVPIGTFQQFKAVYDTSFLGHLGPKWGIMVQHALGNALNATSGSHSITYQSIQSKFS